MIAVGELAPDFSLMDEAEIICQLSDYRGHPVVLYFYPKDDTPGCTKEACGFRDDYRDYEQAEVTILGISPDSPKSHSKFKAKYRLPFTLLSDPGHKICEIFGTWGRKKFMGREYDGVLRTTYLIGIDGRVLHVYENVKPAEHSAEILADLGKAGV